MLNAGNEENNKNKMSFQLVLSIKMEIYNELCKDKNKKQFNIIVNLMYYSYNY